MRSPRPEDDFCSPSSPRDTEANCGGHSAGDSFIEAIADAVARRLERMAGMRQRLMDVHDAAKYLGMTENAIREKASAGELPYIRIDGRLRFDRREIDRWIDRAPRHGV
jgi:excisionase family DNA binding protein